MRMCFSSSGWCEQREVFFARVVVVVAALSKGEQGSGGVGGDHVHTTRGG